MKTEASHCVTISQALEEKITVFSELLDKDPQSIVEEALQRYFVEEERKLLEQKLSERDPMTNLDFDEFWDDVDLE